MRTSHLTLLSIVALAASVCISQAQVTPVTLPDIAEQTIRSAADQNIVVNDNGSGTFPAAAVGFLRVKWVADGSPIGAPAPGSANDTTGCAKTYFRWSFVGQPNPDTNADLQMTWLNAGNSTASTMTLWSLNQPYPFETGLTGATDTTQPNLAFAIFTEPGGTNPAVTFNNAQANDTNYSPTTFQGAFQMLTNGPFTATPVLPNITPGLGAVTLTIPAPWGNLIHQNNGSNELVFCLGGINNAATQGANGFRIANGMTSLVYNPILGTNPPSITLITNMTLAFNATASQHFTVADPDGKVANVSNAVVAILTTPDPTGGTVATVTGSGANQQVNVTAGPTAGSVAIEVTITDENGDEAQRTFTVTVGSVFALSTPANTNTLAGSSVTVPFAVSSGDPYTLTAAVDPASTSVLASVVTNHVSGSNWTVTVTPLAVTNGGSNGVGLVDLTITDLVTSNTLATSFAVLVQANAETVFSDDFAYPAGSLLAVSDGIWTQIGPFGPVLNVANGTVEVAVQLNGESVAASLLGGPYSPGHGDVIYTTFQANWTVFGAVNGWLALGEFNLVNAPASQLAAIGTVPDPAGDGGFNATIVNNDADTVLATNGVTLVVGTTYNIAIRYDVDAAKATLWVNAMSESDPNGTNVTATDIATPVQVSDVTLNQGVNGGAILDTVFLDALKVTVVNKPVIKSISAVGGNVQIVFTAGVNDTPSSFGLRGTTNLAIPFAAVANPNITSLGGGVFQASVPLSGNEGFYRVERQSFVFSY